jgi:hypothetical protein
MGRRRSYPNQKRKRPERRRRHRFHGGNLPVRPNSYQDFGLKVVYDWLLPRLGVSNRRGYFNALSYWTLLGAGVYGAAAGLNLLGGPVGLIVGGVLAISGLSHILRKHRLIR